MGTYIRYMIIMTILSRIWRSQSLRLRMKFATRRYHLQMCLLRGIRKLIIWTISWEAILSTKGTNFSRRSNLIKKEGFEKVGRTATKALLMLMAPWSLRMVTASVCTATSPIRTYQIRTLSRAGNQALSEEIEISSSKKLEEDQPALITTAFNLTAWWGPQIREMTWLISIKSSSIGLWTSHLDKIQ